MKSIDKKSRVLIVEDDLATRRMLVSMLKNQEYETLEASNGEEALNILFSTNLDLIILDIHMPVKNGIDVLKTIKRTKKYLLMPIIVLTIDIHEKIEALRLGASDYLVKPFDKLELSLKIHNQIKIKRYSMEMQNRVNNKIQDLNQKICNVEETQRKFLLKLAMQSERQMFFSDTLKAEKIASYTKEFVKIVCNLPEEILRKVYYSAAFHNIGFISLPSSLKNKKRFTDEDRKMMQKHIEYGAKFIYGLENTELLSIAKPIIEEYCERWDGKGYPKGLKGDDISFYARVVAIVVYFNALTSPRGYRKHNIFTDREVYYLMKRESGKMFDPILLDAFLKYYKRFIKIRDIIMKKRANVIMKH